MDIVCDSLSSNSLHCCYDFTVQNESSDVVSWTLDMLLEDVRSFPEHLAVELEVVVDIL